MRRVTTDTNVIVSALMFGGKPLAVLELAQAGDIELALSEIMNEVLRILRDKFYRSRCRSTGLAGGCGRRRRLAQMCAPEWISSNVRPVDRVFAEREPGEGDI